MYKVREYRKKAGMTQEELAAKSGVSRATIWALEQGKRDVVKSSTLVKLANALGTTVSKIFLDK